ncbi:MAG: tRNA (adenosine(37)-N6)-threonylcarbamoyltransferase complex dimerization subunit type 1 TsaB [Candidatus Saccharibacteria bacterium]|nr:tRNA (adenosine(37)-N6)-threonylcarbamoyltransferase complex dimerization subunit type 1 TsaB [Candidatus Saccharibacteria bacterium]
MQILVIRTDKPDSEIGLFDDDKKIAYEIWPAHRHLAETIHLKIQAMLKKQSLTIQDIEGIVIYKGPGSFTGLRIGISLANALASSLAVPIVGESNEEWLSAGLQCLAAKEDDRQVSPLYGGEPHITQPRK